MYENDVLDIIATVVFVCLTVSFVIAIAIVAHFQWWLYVILIVGAIILSLAYRSIAEYVLCPQALGMIVLIVYDLFSSKITLPAVYLVLMIVWVVLFVVYMIFFSYLRQSIDESRNRWWW